MSNATKASWDRAIALFDSLMSPPSLDPNRPTAKKYRKFAELTPADVEGEFLEFTLNEVATNFLCENSLSARK
jgi:hypothetical protein